MYTNYIVFLILFLISLFIRTTYELLKKAGKVNPKSKVLFSIIFLDMSLLWTSWFSLCTLDTIHIILPNSVRWIGFSLFVVGSCLAVGALIQLKGLENIEHLVTTGLFSKLRHPMYTGFILWIFGWAVYHDAVVSFFVGLIGIGNILYWRKLEEEKLKSSYGETYLLYRKQTWF